jgi:hypothetical protein
LKTPASDHSLRLIVASYRLESGDKIRKSQNLRSRQDFPHPCAEPGRQEGARPGGYAMKIQEKICKENRIPFDNHWARAYLLESAEFDSWHRSPFCTDSFATYPV